MTTAARTPFTANKRRILEAMSDGERHWAEELYQRLEMPRRHSVVMAFHWFARYGYITGAADAVVVIGENRTDYAYILTNKGRAAAANLDHGYDLLNP
jgi:hypothetical protein